jgi:integrase
LEFDLPSKGIVQTVEHHEALTLDEARKVVSYCLSHPPPGSAAILFGIATASRVNEFRMATREEIDGDVWLVPPERRKDGRPYPHRLPLSSLAKKALEMTLPRGPSSWPIVV